jgi:phenylalanyl-tRNA synthetase beta chain
MKVSLNWLSDYVKLPPVDELAARLTMAGLEVEGIARPGAAIAGVVVALVKAAKPHPNADKLQVTEIDAGGAPLQVVCGAKNFKVGDKVPLATVGTSLPNGVTIQKAQLRGVESSGMLCSAKELGLAEDAQGLLILDPSLEPGTPLAEALGLDDVVFEVNVTPNRADALSHLGVAREVSVLTEGPLKIPEAKLGEAAERAADKVKLRIEDAERCPRYAARVIEGVKIGPSPDWLQRRLKACGVRPISNVVDITNYVLMETGQPLHAFDLDRLAGGEIIVRRARPNEKMTTLDGKERALDPDDLLICDRDRAQVLAGVMGGADSEVSGKTTRVLLECAHFAPSGIRRSSKRHALHTESSHRFERGTDVGGVPWVLDRTAALIAELAGGKVLAGQVDVYPAPIAAREVSLPLARVSALLGTEVPEAETRRILEALGFKALSEQSGSVRYRVPSWRVDVDRLEDLVEEVARVRGYDRVPARLPTSAIKPVSSPPSAEAERRVRAALSGFGLDEVVNYSFVDPKDLPWTTPRALGELGQPVESIKLKNPLSVEQSVMRPGLYQGLLANLSRNLRHQVDRVRLYELGRSYRPNAHGGQGTTPVAHERLEVAGVLWGRRSPRTWSLKDEPADFFDAKGAVETIFSALHLEATFQPAEAAPFHPRACARVLSAAGEELGLVGELHPKTAKKLDLPGGVFLFSLDFEALLGAAKLVPEYQGLSKFPAVLRDLAVVVPVELRNEDVRKVILDVGQPLVEEASIFDVYTGKPIPEGRKNLAYALTYRAKDRTLTDAEVSQAHTKIVEEVNRRLGATLRA